MPDPWAIVTDHELAASPSDRRRRGAWYTPRDLVETLVSAVIDGPVARRSVGIFVVDPCCGGGGFLIGVLDRLVGLGVDPGDALDSIGGVDIDPGAVTAARAAVEAWCVGRGIPASRAANVRLAVGDSLAGLPAGWPTPGVIIGNPPFASPLRGGELPGPAVAMRRRRSDLLGPYADLAAVHLVAALDASLPGGRVCLVLPQSLLAGRDTRGLRAHLDRIAGVRSVWASRRNHFDASVKVWAPVLELGADVPTVELLGDGPTRHTPRATISELVAEGLGVPRVGLATAATLGELATATAGFRDEYYGLAAACREQDDADASTTAYRLVTSGALDPLRCRWGRRPTTFARQQWCRPVVDLELLDEGLRRWVGQQRRPKVVLPTQSRVLEPVVDHDGTLVAVTPVIAIHTEEASLGLVAAVLLAPPAVAWAHRRWFGAAMSPDAIKVSARGLAEIPLPPDEETWRLAAALALAVDPFEPGSERSQAVLIEIGRLMNAAYGQPDEVFDWWRLRLPGPQANRRPETPWPPEGTVGRLAR